MNIIIIVVSILVAAVALLLIAALFIKKKYSIRKEIIIRRPLEEVFDYVRYLRNQDHYSKWVMADPSMKRNFSGQDGLPGFIYAWDGNDKVGKGEQEILHIDKGSRIEIEIRFERPFRSIARTPITTERISQNETRVGWGMEGTNKYPLNLMHLLVANVLKRDLGISLQNLKNIIENRQTVIP